LDVVDEEQGRAVAEYINSLVSKTTTRRVIFYQVDISDEAQVKSAFGVAASIFGRIDILVNNAGVFVLKNIEQATVQDWNRSLNINVIGTAFCTKYATEHMKDSREQRPKGAAIVNIASISAWVAQKNMTCYSVTKAAVLQLTRNCAMDLAPYKIRVNCVSPGVIETNTTRLLCNNWGVSFEKMKAETLSKQLVDRLGEPEDVANAALFLASDEASFVTGTDLVVDGGYLDL